MRFGGRAVGQRRSGRERPPRDGARAAGPRRASPISRWSRTWCSAPTRRRDRAGIAARMNEILELFPMPRRAPRAARRHHVGRPAADGGGRHGAHAAAAPHDDGRALHRPGPGAGAARARDRGADQSALRHRHHAGGAEHQDRARRGRARLRDEVGPRRAREARRRTARAPRTPGGSSTDGPSSEPTAAAHRPGLLAWAAARYRDAEAARHRERRWSFEGLLDQAQPARGGAPRPRHRAAATASACGCPTGPSGSSPGTRSASWARWRCPSTPATRPTSSPTASARASAAALLSADRFLGLDFGATVEGMPRGAAHARVGRPIPTRSPRCSPARLSPRRAGPRCRPTTWAT